MSFPVLQKRHWIALITVFVLFAAFMFRSHRDLSFSASITGPLTGGMCSFAQYPLPSSYSPVALYSEVVTDKGGNLWFSQQSQQKMTKMDTAGHMTDYSFASPPGFAAADPAGNVWYASPSVGQIVKRASDGTTQTFNTPAGTVPLGIASGPDGNIWFTENAGNSIGRLTPASGVMKEFPIPTSGVQASKIIPGPDGNLWFIEPAANCGMGRPPHIGRITPAGVVTEYATQTCKVPIDIAAGPDGNIWVTQQGGAGPDLVSSLSATAGTFHDYTVTSGNGAGYITKGPDNNLWFTQRNGGLANITAGGVITEFHNLFPGQSLGKLSIGPDGNLWTMELDTKNVAKVSPVALDQNSCSGGAVTTQCSDGLDNDHNGEVDYNGGFFAQSFPDVSFPSTGPYLDCPGQSAAACAAWWSDASKPDDGRRGPTLALSNLQEGQHIIFKTSGTIKYGADASMASSCRDGIPAAGGVDYTSHAHEIGIAQFTDSLNHVVNPGIPTPDNKSAILLRDFDTPTGIVVPHGATRLYVTHAEGYYLDNTGLCMISGVQVLTPAPPDAECSGAGDTTEGAIASSSSAVSSQPPPENPQFQLYTSPTKLTWQQAEDSCVSKGGHLATISSDADNALAYSLLNGKTNVWIGLNDIAVEGQYQWTCGGKPVTYTNWYPGQPNGAGMSWNDCVFMNHSLTPGAKWHDIGCDGEGFNTTSYLCETGLNCKAQSSGSVSASSLPPADPTCAATKAEQASILAIDLEPLPLSATPPEIADLRDIGYSVTYHTRVTLPTIQSSFLKQFQAVWIFNGCGSQTTLLSNAEVQALHDYYTGGGNLLISVGNLRGKKATSAFDCASRVSQISEPLGVAFNGVTTQTNTCVNVTTNTNSLLTGVQKVFREAYSTMSLLPTVSWGSDKPAFIGSTAKGDPVFAVIKKKSPHGAAFFFPQQGGLQTSCTTAKGYADIFGSLGYKPGCNACTP